MRRNLQILLLGFIVLFLISATAGGCGKKAPPIPPAEKVSKPQSVIVSKY